jgi:hypothetical protein
MKENKQTINESNIDYNLESTNEVTCRICRKGSQIEGKQSSPLISPCLCENQKKYVHQSCLIEYLNKHKSKLCNIYILIVSYKSYEIECQDCNYEFNITYDYFYNEKKINFLIPFVTYFFIYNPIIISLISSFFMLFIMLASGTNNSSYKFLFCVFLSIGIIYFWWFLVLCLNFNYIKIQYKRVIGINNHLYFGLYILSGIIFFNIYELISKYNVKVTKVDDREIEYL